MILRAACKAFVVAVPVIVAANAAGAAELKAEIEAFLQRFEKSMDGHVRWEGADSFDVRTHGDPAIAKLVNARFSLRKEADDAKPAGIVTLDRIDVERKPATGGPNLTEYAISLPPLSTFAVGDNEFTLALGDAKATVTLENPGEHQRGATLSLASGRIEHKNGKSWASIGKLVASSKITPGEKGSWHGPAEFQLTGIEFLLDEAPLAGAVGRITYAGQTQGPSLADLDALRDRLAQLHEIPSGEADKKMRAWADVLPLFLTALGSGKGELTIEGVTTKRPGGETLVTMAKTTMTGGISGLDGEKAALRLAISHEGLEIAPSLTEANHVPRRAVFDIAIEEVATDALRGIADAAGRSFPGASDAEKQKAMVQLLAAAMSLTPVLRLYDFAVDFKDAGIEAAGEAKRAPPAPAGYAASGDVGVRGFDALAEIITARLARAELPLLKFIAKADKAADGTPLLKFHLSSAPGHPLTVNGSDLASWFDARASGGPGSGQARNLRLAEPPMSGDDVRAVQKALKPGAGERFADGVYDSATALAVARFQKQTGINVDGVVDAATRDKLGIKPPPPPPAPVPATPPAPKN